MTQAILVAQQDCVFSNTTASRGSIALVPHTLFEQHTENGYANNSNHSYRGRSLVLVENPVTPLLFILCSA